jgi:hypothetical protein
LKLKPLFLSLALLLPVVRVRADLLKLSTAYNRNILMVDSADHYTGKTGLTLTITASKDGGAFASISPTVTELANGIYKIALTTTHTNTLGGLDLHITATGADATDVHDQVIAIDLGDAVRLGLTALPTRQPGPIPVSPSATLRVGWTWATGSEAHPMRSPPAKSLPI